jgi:hypothetical protein
MYKIKYCESDLEQELFIKEANENNYKIVGYTEFKGKLNILYEVEEKKKRRSPKQIEENIMKEGE